MKLFRTKVDAGTPVEVAPVAGCPELSACTDQVDPTPSSVGVCSDCHALGESTWAHLRMCLTCGHVACCDSSPHTHATAHFHSSTHPVMRSVEPGESWRWCYVHALLG